MANRWEYQLFGEKGQTRSTAELVRITLDELHYRDPDGLLACAEAGMFGWLRPHRVLRPPSQRTIALGEDCYAVVQYADRVVADLPALFHRLWYRAEAFNAKRVDRDHPAVPLRR